AFYGVALVLIYFVNCFLMMVWEFYYNQLKAEKRKEFLLPLAIAGLCLALITTVLYFVALGNDLDAPSNGGFGILPVAFTASINIATLIVVFTPLIVTITALVKALVGRKKKSA
nr:hypothetical protein [Bacilli bacterium]